MPVSDDVLNTVTAQWYNTLAHGLNLATADFQIAQGTLVVPGNSKGLWDMMDQVPTDSIAQFYTPSTIKTFSGEYQSVMSAVKIAGNTAFETAMGDNLAAYKAAWKVYATTNMATVFSAMPGSMTKAQMAYFDEWSSLNLDPSVAAQCSALFAAIYDNPIYIGQQLLQLNLTAGAEVPFVYGEKRMLGLLAGSTSSGFGMSSTTASSDITGAWSNSLDSAGGTYFYTKSSSSEATDFSQTFANSEVGVTASYGKAVTVPIQPLSTGTLTDGGETFQPWFYGAALAAAYEDSSSATWTNPAQWATFFGPTGSFQFVATALVIVDAITHTVTSSAAYSIAEQKYATNQSKDDYGCWPYYVKHDSSSTVQSTPSFSATGQMTTSTTSAAGHPIVVGVLVSSIKSMIAS